MYVLNAFLLCFVLSFQAFGREFSHFKEETSLRWLSIHHVNNLHDLKTETPIKEPKNVLISVLEIYYYNRDFLMSKDCLIYKVPSDDEEGILKIIPGRKDDDNCQKVKFDKGILELKSIYNFGFGLHPKKLSLIIDESLYEYEYTKNNQQLLISFVDNKELKRLQEGDVCFDVGENCELSKIDNCGDCPSGVVRVVTSLCPGVYKKICSAANCGGKGQYACPRGIKSTGYLGEVCIPDSPVAFCRKPFRVICHNNELICQ